MKLEEWLPSQLQQDIWKKKYRSDENEDLESWFKRIAGGNKRIFDLIVSKKFLPAGRILAGRGLVDENNKVSYSNCYLLSPPEDSLEDIFAEAYRLAKTFSYGGKIQRCHPIQ